MARQSIITYERVKEAAEILRAAERSVSNRTVRGEMGEGSFETIAPLLKRVKEEWRQQAEAAAKLEASNFPSGLATAYYQSVDREKQKVRESLQQQIEDLSIQVDEAEEAFADAQGTIEDLSMQIARERSEAAATIRTLEIAGATQGERAAALDESLRQVRGERDAAQAEKATLASDQARLQLDLKRSEEGLQESRKRTAHLEGLVESLQKDLAAAAQRAAVAERHAADTEALCADLKDRCRGLEEDCRGLQGEHRTMTARLLEAQKALAEAQRQGASTQASMAENGAARDTAPQIFEPSVQVHDRPTKSGNGKSKA